MRTRLTVLTFFVALLLVATPLVTKAVTADELRAQIANLLAQIYALRNQVQDNPATVPSTPTTPPIPTTPIQIVPTGVSGTFQYNLCPSLRLNLERGVRGAAFSAEITALQRFLSQDRALYPEGLVTGFFGPVTERAVQRFQERHGIVARGDYQSTGYGRVGPRTRSAINNSCGTSGSNYGFNVSPIGGAAPLQVTTTFDGSDSLCTSYVLDWGDGSTPITQQAQLSQGNCPKDSFRKQATYTYTRPGTYVVTLKMGQGSIYAIPLVARATVTVQAGFGGSSGAGSRSSLFLSAAEGSAPLPTTLTLRSETGSSCTSYSIDWGDGTLPVRYQAPISQFCTRDIFTRQFNHTYSTPGIYLVEARAGSGSLVNLAVMTQPIRVSDQVSNPGTTASSCFVTPSSGSAPLQATARILLGGTLCDGQLTYQIDWGDGTVSPTRECVDQNSHYEQTQHTYTQNGTYTATLMQQHPSARFTEQTCTVSVGTSGGNTGGGVITNSCRNWYDGCNTCSRSYEGGPASCTLRACTTYGASVCQAYFNTTGGGTITTDRDSLSVRVTNPAFRTVEFTALINADQSCNGGIYTIYFGDANDSLQPYPADACQLFTRNVSHTYDDDGTYTALLLKDGIEVDRVTVTVDDGVSKSGRLNIAGVVFALENFIRGLLEK